ncbi:histidine--tRNA ligase [Mechercharimyces sp. CAU 1602]|uniref:histidine--tRNA ligase n=1 Tax=Mechercharimyces sp. CAU 1602 TaxID=2973933 RepID=UPI002161351E|nr:histidine--tRNA ligase [Mechercharimyces sp. CAU 1602]MCS1350249.1 histidine--tRNA ligase [Mechercharimyces sp. CAU 1602]
MQFKVPRGTQDILPGEVEMWQWIEDNIRKICRQYHYAEIRTPMFESTELFKRGVGETTDIVEKEMYTFEDRGGRSLTLRPEGTAPVVRSFVEHKTYGEPQPTKLYYVGPMYRYERPQAGRQRQFHQFGVELFGTYEPESDAEVITLGMDWFAAVGLEGVTVEINSVGCTTCRPVHRANLVDYFTPYQEQLCGDCQSRLTRNPLRILDCKKESCQAIIKDAPSIVEAWCEECTTHFSQVKKELELVNVPYRHNDRLVRGLDYYTRTAFEYMLENRQGGGQASTIGGGGRYNGMVKEMGGPEMSGIGFGIGMERVLLALKTSEKEFPQMTTLDAYVVALGEQAQEETTRILHELRKAGLAVERDLLNRKLKGQMKAADRAGARYVVIIGDEEIKNQRVRIKELASGEQSEVGLEELTHILKEKQI